MKLKKLRRAIISVSDKSKLKLILPILKKFKVEIISSGGSYKKIKSLNPKIQLGFNRRYDPGHNSLKKDLKRGVIGNLEKIIITSRDPSPPSIEYLKISGGIFKDMMIHDFDLLRFYLDKDELNKQSGFYCYLNLYSKEQINNLVFR